MANVFFSYSHKDEALRDELEVHLAMLKREGVISAWHDRKIFAGVVRQLRAALPKSAQAQPSGMVTARPRPAAVNGPRSSNLRIRKEFSDADKDGFLDEAFEYMARFFEASLAELQQRHEGLQTKFKRIDAHTFTAAVYQHGKAVGRCAVVLGGSRGFGGGISYSHDDSARGSSFNESLSVEASEQALFLRPMGMASAWAGGEKGRLTFDGAAEYYWEMLMAPLQR